MKNLTVLFFLLFISVGFAQKKSKIKGDKVKTDVSNPLDGYSTLEIRDNLEVTISKSTDNSYQLATHQNLVDIVKFEVVDSILTIYTTHEISNSKEVVIHLSYNNLREIKLHNKAKVVSRNLERFDEFILKTYDDSKFDLNVSLTNGSFEMSGGSSGKLILKGTESKFTLKDNAKIKGSMVLDQCAIQINNKADMDLSGNVETLNIIAGGSAKVDGESLKTTETEISSSEDSDIEVYATKRLKLFAKGKSKIYIYGDPEIEVVGFRDKSELLKR